METNISLFEITQCGFYSRSHGLHHEFCTLNELLLDLQKWAADRSLRTTKTYTPQDGSDLLTTYLFDIRKDKKGNWLIVTWNETPSFEGAVASADGESTVGSAHVALTEIKEGGIPGYPTYFYIIPSDNIIASVRPQFTSIVTGLPALREYMRSFLGFFSRYAHLEDDSQNGKSKHNLIGYSNDKDSAFFEVGDLSIKFDTREVQNPGKLQYMRDNVEKVSKVIRKTTLDLNHHIGLRWFQRILRSFGVKRDTQKSNQEIHIRYEIQNTINLDELDIMINQWEESHNRTYDDYGLVLRGSSGKPIWFSNSKASGVFDLDVNPVNDALLDPESLLSALGNNQKKILELKA